MHATSGSFVCHHDMVLYHLSYITIYLVKSDNGVRLSIKLRVNSALCLTHTVVAHLQECCNYDLC